MNRFGKNKLICGTKVISKIEITSGIYSGSIAFVNRANPIFVILFTTNNILPTGGVHPPNVKVTTMISPKWTGSIPIALAIGRRIGANTTNA